MSDKQLIIWLVVILVVYFLLRPQSYEGLPSPALSPQRKKVAESPKDDQWEKRFQPRDDIPGYEKVGPLHLCPSKDEE